MEPLVTFCPNNPSGVSWRQWIPPNVKTMESRCGSGNRCQNTNYPSALAAPALKGIVHPELTSPCDHSNWGTERKQWVTKAMNKRTEEKHTACLHGLQSTLRRVLMLACVHIVRSLTGLRMTPAKNFLQVLLLPWRPCDISAKNSVFTSSLLLKLGIRVFQAPGRRRNTSSVESCDMSFSPLE